jgi:hypothetical protein
MIVHIIVGTLREGIDPAGGAELEEAFASLNEVPGILELTYGPDFSGRGKGYNFGAVLKFANRAGLNSYLEHERHLHVVQILNRLLPDRLIIDYEIGTSGSSR